MEKILVSQGPDNGAVFHLGNPSKEGKLIDSGEAWANLSHLGLLEISGKDRLNWLNDLTTQLTLELGKIWQRAFILNAQGRIRFDLYLMDTGESTFILTEKDYILELEKFLNSMKFMLQVEVINLTGQRNILFIDADGELAGKSIEQLKVLTDIQFQQETLKLDLNNEVGSWALEADRIARKIFRMVIDGDEKTIPNEVEQLGKAVHMKKGCYPGQETVAKTFNLGAPPRLLKLIHFDGMQIDLPAIGAPITFEGAVIGRMGSSARHHLLGNIGLALFKRSFLNSHPNANLIIDGIGAVVEQ